MWLFCSPQLHSSKALSINSPNTSLTISGLYITNSCSLYRKKLVHKKKPLINVPCKGPHSGNNLSVLKLWQGYNEHQVSLSRSMFCSLQLQFEVCSKSLWNFDSSTLTVIAVWYLYKTILLQFQLFNANKKEKNIFKSLRALILMFSFNQLGMLMIV